MRYRPPCRNQAGYSLVELMVAVAVALFLLAGMFSILQGTRKTSTNQTALAQLQDNERMAITIMSDVIQEAGFYPNAANTPATTAFPGTAPFSIPGQVVLGGPNPDTTDTTLGETITLGYQPDGTNTVLGCLGTADSATTVHSYKFLIVRETVGSKIVKTLECSKDGATPVPLVSDVNSLTFAYGVSSGGATGTTNTYVSAATLNSGTAPFDWSAVRSVKMTLAFPNPLYGQPGATAVAQQTVNFTRVVSVMSRNGVNVN